MTNDYDGDFSQFDADKLTEKDLTFADSLVRGVIDKKSDLDAIVSDLSRSFRLERIYRPDLAALEMAIFEMDSGDTPCAVAINEAVGIVKKYSTEKSVGYVNGILATYARKRA